MNQPVPKREVAAVLTGLILVFLLPAVVTLLTVEEPRKWAPTEANPTPYGYTWSLSLFLIPSLVLGVWFKRAAIGPIARRGFWWTVLLLPPIGFVLDFLLGHLFFEFTYPGATLGVWIPVLGGDAVPVEEFIFYVLGFIATLLIYVWADEYWLKAYNVPDYELRRIERGIDRVIKFHWPSLLIGGVMVIIAFVFKKCCSEVPEGFPGYFTFLVLAAVMPSMVLYPTALSFINWRALSLTFFILVLISLLWEATLAIPYQWWGYQDRQMMGVFIDAWTNLPLEAALLWMVVSYTTVIVYESIKVLITLRASRPWRETLIGPKSPRPTSTRTKLC